MTTISATPVTDHSGALRDRASWGAILAGAVAMIVTQLVLNLIGVGVGISTLDPGTGDNPSAALLSGGAAAWFVVSGILASALGGYVAGRMAGWRPRSSAALHGFTAWGVSILVVAYLLTSAVGGVLGGAFNGATSVLGGLGRGAGGAVQTAVQTAAPSLNQVSNPLGRIERQVREGTGQDPAALRNIAADAVSALLTGDQAQQEQARQRAVQALAQAQGITPEQAQQQVAQYEQQYRQTLADAKKRATEAAEVAAKAATRGSFVTALALVLGALAALLSALAAGRPEPISTRV